MTKPTDLPFDPILRDLDGIAFMLDGTDLSVRDHADKLGRSIADLAEAMTSMRDVLADMMDRLIALEARVGHIESAAERAWVRECEEGGTR